MSSALIAGLDQLSEGVVLIAPTAANTPTFRVVYANAAFSAALGRDVEDLLGGPLDGLSSLVERDSLESALHRGQPVRYEPRMGPEDGDERQFEWSLHPVRDLDDEISHWLGLLRERTAERQRQRALVEHEKLTSAELLAGSMAHEINNPLASITTNLEWLAATLPTVVAVMDKAQPHPNPSIGPISAALVDALAGAERIESTVRYLSMLSGLQDARRELLDIRLVLESALTELEGQLGDIQILRHYADVPPILAGEQRLKQALVNFLVNAAQAIDAKSVARTITLATYQQRDQRVRVEVTDSGCGVSETVRNRLFAPFVSTKPVGLGKGLSLFLCKTIVEAAGGEVGFRSTPGQGSTFWVELPPAAPVAPAARTP